jgi:hypothetical protein
LIFEGWAQAISRAESKIKIIPPIASSEKRPAFNQKELNWIGIFIS